MDFGAGDEIDGETVLVERAEDGHEEAVCTRAFLGVDVQDGYIWFYCHRSRSAI